MASQEVQRVTTKGVFHNDGKVLLLQDKSGKWELPGGRIQFGEDPKAALKREIAEELGLEDVVVGKIIDARTFMVDKNETHYQFIVLVFECFSKEYILRLSDEHIKYYWTPFEEIPWLNMRDGYKDSIAAYEALMKTENK